MPEGGGTSPFCAPPFQKANVYVHSEVPPAYSCSLYGTPFRLTEKASVTKALNRPEKGQRGGREGMGGLHAARAQSSISISGAPPGK